MKRLMMGTMMVAVLAACGLVLAAEAPAKLYSLQVTPKVEVAAKATGTATIKIIPGTDNHVNAEPTAPFKVTLEGVGLTFTKPTMGHPDVKHEASGTTVEIPFTADAAGDTTIVAKMKFFVCTPKTCMPQSEIVKIPVTVK